MIVNDSLSDVVLYPRDEEALPGLRERYCDGLRRGDGASMRKVIDEALASDYSIETIYLELLMQGQRQVGDLWYEGKLSVAEEHLATQLALAEMSRLRSMAKPRRRLGVKAVISALEGDPHFVAARVVSDFLIIDGWDVDFLGGDTPLQALLTFIERRKPDLVGLSLTLNESVEKCKKVALDVQALPRAPKILCGGRACKELSAELIGADALADDAAEAVLKARDLCNITGTYASLQQYLAELGARLATARKERKLTQQEAANRAGIDRAYLSAVENGKQNMTVGAVFKLAEALEVPVETLLVGEKRNRN